MLFEKDNGFLQLLSYKRLLKSAVPLGLLDLANLYCEEKLKKRCETLIKQNISVENSSLLLEAAIKYNAKVMLYFSLRCLFFGFRHVILPTQDFETSFFTFTVKLIACWCLFLLTKKIHLFLYFKLI